nr:MAG: replication initiator protein [Microviridae sp.]
MPCAKPLVGWRDKGGKVVFSPKSARSALQTRVPCGQCLHCRRIRSLSWAVRIMCEADTHQENSFVTLTYKERQTCLRKKDVQDFFKRFRKQIAPKQIRYFAVGEYGSLGNRPHYHAIIFGWETTGSDTYEVGKVFNSHVLEKTWGHGFTSVGSLTPASAAYVSQYCLKKITGSNAIETYTDPETGEFSPEFLLSSRGGRGGHGLGYEWFVKHQDELWPDDKIYFNQGTTTPPKYFFEKMKLINPVLAEWVQQQRMEKFDYGEFIRLVVKGVAEKVERSRLRVDEKRHKEL